MDRTDDKTSEHREAKTKHRPRYTPILRTVLCNRWILVRSSDLIQLMNVTQVRIVRISRHRLFLELLHVPIVVRHDIITVIFLRHVLLLKLMLMVDRRVTIHDSKLLILAENVADAERGSGDRGRQHSNAFSSNVDDSCEYSNDELHFPMLTFQTHARSVRKSCFVVARRRQILRFHRCPRKEQCHSNNSRDLRLEEARYSAMKLAKKRFTTFGRRARTTIIPQLPTTDSSTVVHFN